jgi:hypothetical protein
MDIGVFDAIIEVVGNNLLAVAIGKEVDGPSRNNPD